MRVSKEEEERRDREWRARMKVLKRLGYDLEMEMEAY